MVRLQLIFLQLIFFPRKCKLSSKGTLHKLDEFPWWANQLSFFRKLQVFQGYKKLFVESLERQAQLVLSSGPGALWAEVGLQLAQELLSELTLRDAGCTAQGGSGCCSCQHSPSIADWGSGAVPHLLWDFPVATSRSGHLRDLRCTSHSSGWAPSPKPCLFTWVTSTALSCWWLNNLARLFHWV